MTAVYTPLLTTFSLFRAVSLSSLVCNSSTIATPSTVVTVSRYMAKTYYYIVKKSGFVRGIPRHLGKSHCDAEVSKSRPHQGILSLVARPRPTKRHFVFWFRPASPCHLLIFQSRMPQFVILKPCIACGFPADSSSYQLLAADPPHSGTARRLRGF